MAIHSTTIDDLRTYVVNLPRRTDRRRRIEQILPPQLKVTFTSDWDDEFDGLALDRPILQAAGVIPFPWQILSDNEWWSRPLKLGEIGCTLAHLKCWQDAAARGNERFILILEDDADFQPDFLDPLLSALDQYHDQFGLLYLGRFPLEPDHQFAPSIVRPGYSHCTFGYLLTRAALEVLIAQQLELAVIPVDEFLPAMYINHPRPDIQQRFPRQLTALAFEPPIVRQLPKQIAGSDTEATSFLDE